MQRIWKTLDMQIWHERILGKQEVQHLELWMEGNFSFDKIVDVRSRDVWSRDVQVEMLKVKMFEVNKFKVKMLKVEMFEAEMLKVKNVWIWDV